MTMYLLCFISVFMTIGLVSGNYNYSGYNTQSTKNRQDRITGELSYCKIATRDFTSTIKKRANRILKGVCNPHELDKKFVALENQIVDHFNVLKAMVAGIEYKLKQQSEKMDGLYRQEDNENVIKKEKDLASSTTSGDEFPIYTDIDKPVDGRIYDEELVPSIREREVAVLNSTTHLRNGSNVFTYYWRVNDLRHKMETWDAEMSLRSISFYVFQYGYRMYIRIIPNSFGHVYIKVGLTKGEYDATLVWPFSLKQKIQILDHRSDGEDITSRLWNPAELCSALHWKQPTNTGDNEECVGLGFPQELLYSRNYIHNDEIIVKLTIYLD